MKLKNTNTAIVSYEISIDTEEELRNAKRILRNGGSCWRVDCYECPFNDDHISCDSYDNRVKILKILLEVK